MKHTQTRANRAENLTIALLAFLAVAVSLLAAPAANRIVDAPETLAVSQ